MFPPNLEDRIAEFAKIARVCPEDFQQSCFTALLKHYLDTAETSLECSHLDCPHAKLVKSLSKYRDSLSTGVPCLRAVAEPSVCGEGARDYPNGRVPQWFQRWLPQILEKANRVRVFAGTCSQGLYGAIGWVALCIVLFLAFESVVFRSGWYEKYLKPDSTTAQIEYRLFWLSHTPSSGSSNVMVVGDSRIAEGFSPGIAQHATGNKIRFTSFGMPGTSPRVWYYALRDADPTRRRFSAITIALDHYADTDASEDLANREADISYVVGRLRLTDCWEFSRSFTVSEVRRRALTGCFLKGTAMRSDILDFLSDIPQRLTSAKDWRNHGLGYTEGYGGRPEDLSGLSVDMSKETIVFPAGVKDWQINSIRATVLPTPAAQTGNLTAYRMRWLGALLALYKNSPTRIIFIQIPRAPLPIPLSQNPQLFLESVQDHPNITILPVDTFEDLQRPDLFADGLHLNHVGRAAFSDRLGARILHALQ